MQKPVRTIVYELLVGCIQDWESLSREQARNQIQKVMRTYVVGLYMGQKNPEQAALILALIDEKDGILGPHQFVADVVIEEIDKVLMNGSGRDESTERDIGPAETNSRKTK